MKDFFALICVRFAKRNSDVRKRNFLKWLQGFCQANGMPVTIDEKKERKHASRNLIAGDLKNADTVVITGYDTANKIIVPGYKYYPFNVKKDHKGEITSLILQLVISVVLIIAFYFVVKDFMNYNIWLKVLAVVVSAILILFIFFLGKGMANKYNFNKNTAAFTVQCYLMLMAAKKANKKVAFIFTDNTAASFYGYSQIGENQKADLKGKHVVVMDCIMTPGTIFAAFAKDGKDDAKRMKEADQSVKLLDYSKVATPIFTWLPTAVYLTSGDLEGDLEVAIKNTRSRKDCNADFERMNQILDMMCKFTGIEKTDIEFQKAPSQPKQTKKK